VTDQKGAVENLKTALRKLEQKLTEHRPRQTCYRTTSPSPRRG